MQLLEVLGSKALQIPDVNTTDRGTLHNNSTRQRAAGSHVHMTRPSQEKLLLKVAESVVQKTGLLIKTF